MPCMTPSTHACLCCRDGLSLCVISVRVLVPVLAGATLVHSRARRCQGSTASHMTCAADAVFKVARCPHSYRGWVSRMCGTTARGFCVCMYPMHALPRIVLACTPCMHCHGIMLHYAAAMCVPADAAPCASSPTPRSLMLPLGRALDRAPGHRRRDAAVGASIRGHREHIFPVGKGEIFSFYLVCGFFLWFFVFVLCFSFYFFARECTRNVSRSLRSCGSNTAVVDYRPCRPDTLASTHDAHSVSGTCVPIRRVMFFPHVCP